MKIDGRCYCGAITFTSEIDPNAVQVCHCTDCQMFTGTAFRISVAAKVADTKFTGTPKTFIKVADSGRRRQNAFCGDCSAQLFSCDEVNPQSYNLRVGVITQRNELRPLRQIWTHSKLPWLDEAMKTRVEEVR